MRVVQSAHRRRWAPCEEDKLSVRLHISWLRTAAARCGQLRYVFGVVLVQALVYALVQALVQVLVQALHLSPPKPCHLLAVILRIRRQASTHLSTYCRALSLRAGDGLWGRRVEVEVGVEVEVEG
ncbi:hypothetical protein EYF80_055608 [Liparis tanakae]|uniref:Uncharacterized protein n=1 Tax=Liparis tanakae TaxID=230148 RepID=A0A4Z2F026_9TELE|nr:hypothetical protein EYF80_055608 [Liparis tanakae]